jgi:tRNA A-37 threonylcarbamoyl transferase component Bud32
MLKPSAIGPRADEAFEPGWLDMPAVEVFKHDPRSRVWAIETHAGLMVVKRYEYSGVRQRLEWVIGTHPLLDELKAFGFLNQMGLPTAQIMAQGIRGGQGFLVTRHFGEALQGAIYRGRFNDPAVRKKVARNVGALMARLWQGKVYLRDFKAANLLVNLKGELAIIDPGRKQVMRGPEQFAKMARLMSGSTRRAGASRTDVLRAWREAMRGAEGDAGMLEAGMKGGW